MISKRVLKSCEQSPMNIVTSLLRPITGTILAMLLVCPEVQAGRFRALYPTDTERLFQQSRKSLRMGKRLLVCAGIVYTTAHIHVLLKYPEKEKPWDFASLFFYSSAAITAGSFPFFIVGSIKKAQYEELRLQPDSEKRDFRVEVGYKLDF
jgi:hypothetical protein